MSDLDRDTQRAIMERGLRNPEYFCYTFFPHLFTTPIPSVHRGTLAILTRQTKWLLEPREFNQPPDLSWIVRNFIEKDEQAWIEKRLVIPKRQIFRVFDASGRELSWEEIQEREEGTSGLPEMSVGASCQSEPSYRAYSGLTVRLDLGRFTALLLPRGLSKTTLAGNVIPIRKICYQDGPFFVYVSETATHAEMQVNNIRHELGGNTKLRAVFGDLVPGTGSDLKWSEEFFETANGMAMAARGRGAQIRGLLHRGQRPNHIICDDLEDKESVSTENQRQKTRSWAYGDLQPALPKEALCPDSTITAIGTMLHEDCLLARWGKDPQWSYISMGAQDLAGDALWPLGLPLEHIAKEKESYALQGEIHIFYLEYYNEPRAEEDHPFKPGMIQRDMLKEGEYFTTSVTYCDPAISAKKRASACVILTVGMTNLGRIGVRFGVGKKGMNPRELIDNFFNAVQTYKCVKSGIESIQYQAALIHLVREEMFRKKHYFVCEPVPNSQKKAERIKGIIYPRAHSGYIFFCGYFPELVAQLLDFNPKKEDQELDWPDALAGAIALLDDAAPQAAGGDLEKDEFEELDENFGRWAS